MQRLCSRLHIFERRMRKYSDNEHTVRRRFVLWLLLLAILGQAGNAIKRMLKHHAYYHSHIANTLLLVSKLKYANNMLIDSVGIFAIYTFEVCTKWFVRCAWMCHNRPAGMANSLGNSALKEGCESYSQRLFFSSYLLIMMLNTCFTWSVKIIAHVTPFMGFV